MSGVVLVLADPFLLTVAELLLRKTFESIRGGRGL